MIGSKLLNEVQKLTIKLFYDEELITFTETQIQTEHTTKSGRYKINLTEFIV